MRYTRINTCKPGDVLFFDACGEDGTVLVERGTILDSYYFNYLQQYHIYFVTICTSEKEVESVSTLNLFYRNEDDRIKSFAHHFVNEVLCNPRVSQIYGNMNKSLKRHSVNVSMLTAMMLGKNRNNMIGSGKEIVTGALLHDVGKDNVPEEILNAERRLTKQEKEFVNTHTTSGFSKLSVLGFSNIVCDIALMHHETFDGTGYPNGFSGDEIPIYVDIVHIADVYEAICAKRVYKNPIERNKAKEIITEQKHQYKPEVFDLFMTNIPSYFINDMIKVDNRIYRVIGYDNEKEPILRNIVTQEDVLLSEIPKDSIMPMDFEFERSRYYNGNK